MRFMGLPWGSSPILPDECAPAGLGRVREASGREEEKPGGLKAASLEVAQGDGLELGVG